MLITRRFDIHNPKEFKSKLRDKHNYSFGQNTTYFRVSNCDDTGFDIYTERYRLDGFLYQVYGRVIEKEGGDYEMKMVLKFTKAPFWWIGRITIVIILTAYFVWQNGFTMIFVAPVFSLIFLISGLANGGGVILNARKLFKVVESRNK